MNLGIAVAKRIDELIFEKGWSLYKLSKESCVPLSTLKNFYSGHTKSPTLAVIYNLANALHISVVEFLNCPLLDESNLELN